MDIAATPANERRKVGMLLPPPVLLGLLVKIGLAVQAFAAGGLATTWAQGLAGAAVIALSIGLVAWSAAHFRKAGTPVRPTSPTTAIVSSGPYRFSRSPMYLGMAGVLAGLAVVFGSLVFVAATAVFVAVVHHGVVLREERYLIGLHGAAYARYMQQVRRWV